MDRYENIKIFEDSLSIMKREPLLRRAVGESIKNQRLIREGDIYEGRNSGSAERKGEVTVSKKRTLEAASFYKGKKTVVLNFASAVTPGGGVKSGSSAQEESISRISTLYPCLSTDYLWKNFYVYHRNLDDRRNNDDTIYTPGVVVFKSDESYPVLTAEKDWFSVNVITTAAPDLRRPRSFEGRYVEPGDEEIRALHIRRAERILEIASGEGNEVIILGAFGCGAFRNPPSVVASAWKEALDKYRFYFDSVEFAVYCNPCKGETENYDVFRRILG